MLPSPSSYHLFRTLFKIGGSHFFGPPNFRASKEVPQQKNIIKHHKTHLKKLPPPPPPPPPTTTTTNCLEQLLTRKTPKPIFFRASFIKVKPKFPHFPPVFSPPRFRRTVSAFRNPTKTVPTVRPFRRRPTERPEDLWLSPRLRDQQSFDGPPWNCSSALDGKESLRSVTKVTTNFWMLKSWIGSGQVFGLEHPFFVVPSFLFICVVGVCLYSSF